MKEKEMEEKITPEEKRRILSMAIATYGADMQIIVAIEEMSELIKAITKYIRAGIASDDISEIVADAREEMADVRIMLDQLVIIFGDTTEEENFKLKRLRQRINDDTNELAL